MPDGHRAAAKYDMSFAAVQKHVAVLDNAGLLTKRRNGREQLTSGDVDAVRVSGVHAHRAGADLTRPHHTHRRTPRIRHQPKD